MVHNPFFLTHPPGACVFHTRCPLAEKICAEVEPEYRQVYRGYFVACHLVDEKGSSMILR